MSNLSELLPAGAGAKSAEFVASGTLGSGVTVILNSDGTVSAVAETTQTASIGSATQITANRPGFQSAVYDASSGKVVFTWIDEQNSDYPTAAVGTISGTSISFGTPVVIFSHAVENLNTCYDSANSKIIVVYRNGANSYGNAHVGTVSGTSISFSTDYNFTTVATGASAYGLAYDSANSKFVVTYSDSSSSGRGTAIVGTVSGTAISYGSPVVYESTNSQWLGLTYDSANGKVVAVSNANYTEIKAYVGTVSGTSISFGSAVTVNSGQIGEFNAIGYDVQSGKVVVAYEDRGNSYYGTAKVGTVSGTSISFGSAVVFNSANTANAYFLVGYDANVGRTNIFFRYATLGDGVVATGTVSGTSITFDSNFTASSDNRYVSAAYDSVNKKWGYGIRPGANDFDGAVFTTAGTITNVADFIGITDQAIADTATGAVIVQGGVITNSGFNIPLETGTEANLTGKTQSPYPSITYDITNSKFVVFFQDGNNSNYGTAVVVTVSGTTVTFGTPVVFNSGSTNYIDATYSENNGKHLVVYPDYGNSQQATAIVGTVSGTSISFGSEQVYDTGTANTGVSVAYNSTLDKYLAGSTPSLGTINVTVLTVSGTTVSAGTPVSLSGTKYKPNIASNESASDFVLTNNKNDNQSEAHLISVSGTVPTVETSTDLSAVVSTSYPNTGLAFLGDNKFVCVYSENNTNNMYTRTITVSGTSLSLGTASSAFTVDPDSQTTISGMWPLFKVTTSSAYLYYQDDTSNYFKYVPISISGTTATSGTEVTYTSEISAYAGFLYSADAKQSLSFYQSADSGQQTAAIAQNGALTTGSDYYVQSDGSLSTTVSSVPAGRALSTTSILLEG